MPLVLRLVVFSFVVWSSASIALGQSSKSDEVAAAISQQVGGVQVNSSKSMIHVGSLDSFDKTPGGVRAASTMLEGLQKKNPVTLRSAAILFDRLIPDENFGGEYSSLAWFCDVMLSTKAEREKMLADPFVNAFYHLFTDGDNAVLVEYLQRKYELGGREEQRPGSDRRFRFLEDVMLFNNPRREVWEKSSKLVEALGLRPGDTVLDLGCGPGYYTFKFSNLVGNDGIVYAIDISREHNEYVGSLVKTLGVENVVIAPTIEEVIDEDNRVDYIFSCSLYHVIYSSYKRDQVDEFIDSIKGALNDHGKLIIVDNGLVADNTLPYHGPCIAKELIINQLAHYGFKLVAAHQFIPQRYALVFELNDDIAEEAAKPNVKPRNDWVPIKNRMSLVHVPTEGVTRVIRGSEGEAHQQLLTALEENDPAAVRAAMDLFKELIPRERFGGEYTACLLVCEYILASQEERAELLQGPMAKDYIRALSEDNWKALKGFLDHSKRGRSEDDGPESREEPRYWRDFIYFNNPNRYQWEKTDKFMDLLNVKPGEVIADVGSGSGFYTFKFSELVGKTGHVYALETNVRHLQYISEFIDRYDVNNISVVNSAYNDVRLKPESVDTIFLCSVYHVVYATSMENVKDMFVDSMKSALRKNGRLVIVDNSTVEDDEIPYHGGYIAKELVIAQLEHYGFELVKNENPIPQRYYLEFKLKAKK